METTLNELKDICQYVFWQFLTKDFNLIENKNYEPTVSGRMAMYFRDKIIELENDQIFVDVEYNKFENNEKLKYQNKIKSKTNKTIRPDIIIHTRNKQNNNFLYCELKKNSSRNGADKEKVEKQVEDKNYKFGLYINRITEKQKVGKEIQFQIFDNNKWHFYTYYLKTNKIMEITNEQRIFSKTNKASSLCL